MQSWKKNTDNNTAANADDLDKKNEKNEKKTGNNRRFEQRISS